MPGGLYVEPVRQPDHRQADGLHAGLEASRLAYGYRNAYVGDPDYVHVPPAGLLNPAFAATRRCLIRGAALTSPVAAGSPFAPFSGCAGTDASIQASLVSPESHHTNNIVTEDKWGDIVAYTNTINFFAGSGELVPGATVLTMTLTGLAAESPLAGGDGSGSVRRASAVIAMLLGALGGGLLLETSLWLAIAVAFALTLTTLLAYRAQVD